MNRRVVLVLAVTIALGLASSGVLLDTPREAETPAVQTVESTEMSTTTTTSPTSTTPTATTPTSTTPTATVHG